jgi:hypothetical protein
MVFRGFSAKILRTTWPIMKAGPTASAMVTEVIGLSAPFIKISLYGHTTTRETI